MVTLSPELKARLAPPLKIGGFEVSSRVLQSPLSGVTDLVFRRLVRRYAPTSMMYTEMVNATGLHYVKALPKIMEIDPNERPISIQLFDCRPDFLAEAAIMAVADANAKAIELVASAIRQPGGEQAVQLKVAEKAVEAYSRVASDATTTLIVPSNMTEVAALISSAMKMVQTNKA